MSRKHDARVENNETYPKTPHTGRGFFAVLMLCLIAVGGVVAATFSDTLHDASLQPEQTTTATPITTTTAQQAAVAPATTTTTKTTVTTTTTTAPATPLYVLPLSNNVLTAFCDTPVYNETLDTYRAHTAVDFDGEEGQPVKPLADGTVSAVETDTLWGGCVTVDHGAGVISVYRGVDAHVEVGDEVTTENTLGTLAAVPCESTLGPHLHLELYKDGQAADAATLFDKQLVYD